MSITDRVREQLRKEISDGLYPGGSLLPTRHELMDKYSISRGSIDKVIKQLVQEGVLDSHQGSGTYVRSPDARPHIYIILNNDVECAEANKFNTILSQMLTQLNGMNYSVHCSSNIEEYFSQIILNTDGRVIWSRPSIRARYYIKKLNESGIKQILINRQEKNFNYLATDTVGALEKITAHIKTQKEHPRIGLLVPPFSEEEPFLAAREIYFQESLFHQGLQLAIHQRTSGKKIADVSSVLSDVLKGTELDYLFVPDHDMLAIVQTYMVERGHAGRVRLVSFDGELDSAAQGSVTIRQNWQTMFQSALDWACSEKPGDVQKLILPELVFY